MKGDKIYYYDRGAFYVLNRAFHKETDLLLPDYSCKIGIYPDYDIATDFIKLTKDGLMTIMHGYGWDGPSGPTFNTKSTMRTSLLHDAGAQLTRLGLLDKKWIPKLHDNLRNFGIEDGMWEWRANLWHSKVVQKGMSSSMTNWKIEKEIIAP